MKLRTLADARTLIGHLPKEHRAKDTWQHVTKTLNEAARGGAMPRDPKGKKRLADVIGNAGPEEDYELQKLTMRIVPA